MSLFFHPVLALAPYLAPPPSLSAPACSEQVQDPTTAQNEPVIPPVIQAPVATPPAHVESAVPALEAPPTQQVTFEFESASTLDFKPPVLVPASAQHQEQDQQSDDHKRDSPKKVTSKEKSLRAKEVRRAHLHRVAKSQRNNIVAQKRSTNSVAQSSEVARSSNSVLAQSSEVAANALEEVSFEDAILEEAAEHRRQNEEEIRNRASERRRQNEEELRKIDEDIDAISMDLALGDFL